MPSVAPFADAGLTAYHAVKAVAIRLAPGTVVAVVGIGGLGQFAVQLLKLLTQATVIAIDVDEERLNIARALGADLSVSSVDGRFAGALREVTGGARVNVMMDFVGAADTIQESMSALERGGLCCVVGYGGVAAISSRQLVQGQLVIQGSLAGSYQDLKELMELQRLGKIQSSYQTYPLESAGDILQRLDAGELSERAVLVPS
jgi:NAD+-dependent secondary alcohol dehydrogenase Adh1